MSFLRSKAYGSTFVLAAKPFTLKAVNSKPRGSLRRSQIFFPREEIKWQFGGKKSLACELGVLPVFFFVFVAEIERTFSRRTFSREV